MDNESIVKKKLRQLTSFTCISVGELVAQVKKEINELKTRREGEDVICPICQCELFENLDFQSAESQKAAQVKYISGEIPHDYVIMMDRCSDHYFHLECLESQLSSNTFLECSTCMLTYGVKTGDQPPGTMNWYKDS